MKTPYFFLLTLCAASGTYAAAPVLNDPYSGVYDVPAYQAPVAPVSVASSLNKLQKDVSQLKGKVAEQSKVMNDLNKRTNALEHGTVARSSLTDSPYDVRSSSVSSYPIDNNIPLADSPAEKSRYSRAYAIFRGGNFDQAIAEFQAIISTYPDGEYADNSQYWIGEALLKKGNKQSAMVAFDRVIRIYPRSPKVPDALLKLGMTQYSLGNKVKAKEYYDYLIASYPGTSAANIAYDRKMQAGL